MPIIPITQADLMKTQNLDPGWYGAKIVKVHSTEKAKSGTSFNYPIDAEVEGTGKVITMTFNSILIGKLNPLWKACTGTELTPSNTDTDQLLGKKFDGKVGPRLYEGNMYDEFQAFLPYGTSKGVNDDIPF